MVDNTLVSTIRGITSGGVSLGGAYSALRMTNMESLAMVTVEDRRAELTRGGYRWGGGCGVIANGIAPNATIPTTSANIAIYNSAPATGVTIFVNRVTASLGSGTAAAGASLIVGIPVLVQAAASTMITNHGVANLNGSNGTAKGIIGTATMPAGTIWFPIGGVSTLAAANVGQGIGSFDFEGELAIRPGWAVGFGVFSAAGTSPLFSFGFTWAEVPVTVV